MTLFPLSKAPTYEELEMELAEEQTKNKRLEDQLDDSEDAYEALLEKRTELEQQLCELPEFHHLRLLSIELITFLESDIELEIPKKEKHIWNYISSSIKQAIQNTNT